MCKCLSTPSMPKSFTYFFWGEAGAIHQQASAFVGAFWPWAVNHKTLCWTWMSDFLCFRKMKSPPMVWSGWIENRRVDAQFCGLKIVIWDTWVCHVNILSQQHKYTLLDYETLFTCGWQAGNALQYDSSWISLCSLQGLTQVENHSWHTYSLT